VEIKILDKLLNDPNRSNYEKKHLITMQDYFVFKDFLCIVFECLSKSLYDVILQTEKGLPLDMVRDYLRQILEALITFKDSDLIHCDLKPENIMVDDDLKTLKLIDFGSAAFNGH
jgi:dual specificity protein kinase YAK1